MSRSWNGEALVDEFSTLLGDTSSAFKARVLGWINDTIIDISTRHDWGHHLTKGKKYLAAESETHSLEITPPAAPVIDLKAGGSLSLGSTYCVLVTFLQANGVESVAGASSEGVKTTDGNQSLTISEIPTSLESLVTKRRIYLKKDDEEFYLHTELDDNFTIELTITENTTSPIEPPDYTSIRRLKGSPFFEGEHNAYLEYRDIDQLRRIAQGSWELGNPEFFSPIEANSIATYPVPSSDMEVSFNYYRNPFKLYYLSTSQPDLPVNLKPALKAGVVAMGYEYRDRAGQEMKKANYENALDAAINRGGRVANIEYAVRDVYGNMNGFEVG